MMIDRMIAYVSSILLRLRMVLLPGAISGSGGSSSHIFANPRSGEQHQGRYDIDILKKS